MSHFLTKAQAMKDLPVIEDEALRQGLEYALWLYLDRHWGLKKTIDKAAEKHSVKPKVALERLLRQVIPEEVILERMTYPRSSQKTGSQDGAVKAQRFKSMDKSARSHLINL
ncbi:hypothetical protein [Photobacterium leiognathi]|uniref:hypothetical protein n=1 Tax=Photobacterium leiognathi TaxID=553611 RepID=UPI002981D5A8|nr:hypothetical protein [Photobacterium leiognathi]